MTATAKEIEAAKALLKANDFVVVKAASYRRAQERQRIAECRERDAIADRDRQFDWMERYVFPRERHLSDRINFVYGVARAHGATVEELSGNLLDSTDPLLRRAIESLLQDAAIAGDWKVGDLAHRIRTLIETPHYEATGAHETEATDAP